MYVTYLLFRLPNPIPHAGKEREMLSIFLPYETKKRIYALLCSPQPPGWCMYIKGHPPPQPEYRGMMDDGWKMGKC